MEKTDLLMLLDTLLSQLPTTVRNLRFPVYGLVDHPLDLSICSYGEGTYSTQQQPYSVSFIFTSPRYPEERNTIEIISADATIEHKKGNPVFELTDARYMALFRQYHLTEDERKQMGTPQRWEGTLTIEGQIFSATILYWSQPRQLALFLLKSKVSILSGMACGPSYEELCQLLQSLQIINMRADVLDEYQNVLYQEVRSWLDRWDQ